MKRLLLSICMAISCGVAYSQAQHKVPVIFDETTDDVVGKQIAYHIKESIRKSANMELVYETKKASYQLRFTSLPLDAGSQANGSAYSMVITMDQFDPNASGKIYITSSVGVCGARRVESCAVSIVATLDSEIERHRRQLFEALEKLGRMKK